MGEFAPQARVLPDHPLNAFLGGPLGGVAQDIDKASEWYNAAYSLFVGVREHLNSDAANVTTIWAQGQRDKVIAVLGKAPSFAIHPKDGRRDGFRPGPTVGDR